MPPVQVTPRAVLEPVELGGVTIRYCSLHSVGVVRALDVRPGDLVTIKRAGDVIPQVCVP